MSLSIVEPRVQSVFIRNRNIFFRLAPGWVEMKKIAFITLPDAKYGFRLGGVPHYAVEPSELQNTLAKVIGDPENGLAVVDERFVAGNREAEGLSEDRLREIEQGWQGILLVLPSPRKPIAEDEDYAARLIRRAIGYHVRLKL